MKKSLIKEGSSPIRNKNVHSKFIQKKKRKNVHSKWSYIGCLECATVVLQSWLI